MLCAPRAAASCPLPRARGASALRQGLRRGARWRQRELHWAESSLRGVRPAAGLPRRAGAAGPRGLT